MILAAGRLCLTDDRRVGGGERGAVPAPERADVCATEQALGKGVIGAARRILCAAGDYTRGKGRMGSAADCQPPSCPMGLRP